MCRLLPVAFALFCCQSPAQGPPLPKPGEALNITGELTAQNSRVGWPRQGHLQRWIDCHFTIGVQYTIRLEPADPMAAWPANDPYLLLLNGNVILAEDDDSGDRLTAAQIVFTPQKTGTYSVVCTTSMPHVQMRYRLIIVDNRPNGAPPNS